MGPFPSELAVQCEAVHYVQAIKLDRAGHEKAMQWGEARLDGISRRIADAWPGVDIPNFRAEIVSHAQRLVTSHPDADYLAMALQVEEEPCAEFRREFEGVF